MSVIPELAYSNLPEEGLRFFHGLSNWLESIKGQKLHLIEWENGQKKLSGRFSLDAIREFVNIYLEPKEFKNNAKQ